jgi:hypothetical protein
MCTLATRQMPSTCIGNLDLVANLAISRAADLLAELPPGADHTPVRARVYRGDEAKAILTDLTGHADDHARCREPMRCVASYDQLAGALEDPRVPPGTIVLLVVFCDYVQACPAPFFCAPVQVPQ